MESRQVKGALSAMRNKTDKHDARAIAQILRSGWYSRVHVKSIESHHIRMLLSSRRAVLSKCVDLENEVRGLFKIFGLKLPPKLGHGAFDDTVRDIIEADEALSHAKTRPTPCHKTWELDIYARLEKQTSAQHKTYPADRVLGLLRHRRPNLLFHNLPTSSTLETGLSHWQVAQHYESLKNHCVDQAMHSRLVVDIRATQTND